MRLIFFLFFALACHSKRSELPPHCNESTNTRLVTKDGAEITLHRHPASGPAVLVIHGIASNHRSWDLTEERSIAVALQRAGMDAWLIDLRGHGEALRFANGQKQRHGWSLDDYGAHDLHTAIEHILQIRETTKVALIGHSMGGMVAAAYSGHHGDAAIAGLVVVGSPIQFSDRDFMLNLGSLAMKMGSAWRSLGMQTGAGMLGQIPGKIPIHGEGLLFNPKNLAPEMRTKMLKTAVSPVSREEMRQFVEIFRSGRFLSTDGTLDYQHNLSMMDAPFFAISGSNDRIVPPQRVHPWTTAVSSTDTTYIEAGTSNGFSTNYGHLDLIMGDHAPAEIHQPIIQWLTVRMAE